MKLNNTKKINKAFDPIRHWYQSLIVMFIIFVSIAIYGFYSFFYIKNEILLIELESKNNVQNSNSAEFLEKTRSNTKFLKDINNLNKILTEFEKKEIEYYRLINSGVKAVVSISTTTATSSNVATSTQ